MSEKEQELISILLEESGQFTKSRARSVSSFFDSLKDFSQATESSLVRLAQHSGKQALRREEIASILSVIGSGVIDINKPVSDNFIAAVSRSFTRRQLEMLRSLDLDAMYPNPFLIQSLNLSTPDEVVRLNVYAAATRSIVTSFGMVVQNMLSATSESVHKVRSGWDLLKVKDGVNHWVQVKSGTNDMDKDQIVYWAEQIGKVEESGEKGYIGMTYGKRDNQTVTLSLLKSYLPDQELKTLIGRELWDFLSGDPELHSRILDILRREAVRVLNGNNIVNELEACIERVKGEFVERYGDGPEGIRKYINDIF